MTEYTLIDLFNFKQEANRPAFKINDRSILLSEFFNDIQSVVELKSITGHRIALCFQDSYQFSISFFACLVLNKIPILLPNNQTGTLLDFEAEYDFILNEDNIKSYSNICPNKSINNLVFHENQEIILFTSGSTGKAKKVVRTLKQLFCEISVLERTFINGIRDINIYATVSHQHIYGLIFLILWPLQQGRTINLPILNYPEEIELLKSNAKPFMLVSSPALLKRLTVNRITDNSCSKIFIFSSGGLLEKKYAEIVFQVFCLYPYEILGSTETGGVAYRQQKKNNIRWSLLPQVSFTSDDTRCLKVHSAFFTDDQDEYFLMGDKVRFNSDKSFELLGRSDRIVKIEEKRISLIEIENQIKQHSFVQDAYALALESNRQYVAIVIELNSDGSRFLISNRKLILNKKLINYLLNYFDRILLPKKFRYVEDIPTSTQGKRLLSDIKALFENNKNEIP
ncbi:MAG: acyl-coenzyme A synthetase/AMP-(fatty) acid ligase [Francisellaceae bacterium]|jgi:acyl-coenzyme A synthetase/AMP-(fatty) acid ligase